MSPYKVQNSHSLSESMELRIHKISHIVYQSTSSIALPSLLNTLAIYELCVSIIIILVNTSPSSPQTPL